MGYTGKSLHKNSPPRQSEYLAWRRTPRTFSLEGQWGLSVGATEDWEKQRICYGSKDTGSRSPRGYWLPWALLEVPLSSLRPSPTEKPTDSSAGNPQAKEPTGQEHSPTHQESGHIKSPQAWLCHQRDKIQLHASAGRNHSLPLVSQYKALWQLYPPEGRCQKQEKL